MSYEALYLILYIKNFILYNLLLFKFNLNFHNYFFHIIEPIFNIFYIIIFINLNTSISEIRVLFVFLRIIHKSLCAIFFLIDLIYLLTGLER